jgi:Uncharacterized protein conserved in bacteria (DUF2252)
MDIVKATARYEAWLTERLPLIRADLDLKHRAMSAGLFPFIRGTFYRWAARWESIVGDVADAPRVLAVGDLHVENFGTWRDSEGRLIWGVNDFDEAYSLPYTNDLVRLVTSVVVAVGYHDLNLDTKDAAAAIEDGYRETLAEGGHAYVLAENHVELREMAEYRLHDPEKFWNKLEAFPTIRSALPAPVASALDRSFPERGLEKRIVHRVAGVGSLGRHRFVALAHWRGGRIAREAKALAPSACVFANSGPPLRRALWSLAGFSRKIHYDAMLRRGVRCPDPCVGVSGEWLVRRLAPDCTRITLNALPKKRDERRLLQAMGGETANIHLGSLDAKALLADLKRRDKRWLYDAASKMADDVTEDWRTWRKHYD